AASYFDNVKAQSLVHWHCDFALLILNVGALPIVHRHGTRHDRPAFVYVCWRRSMATKRTRLAGRAAKKRTGRKRVTAKRAFPKRLSSTARRRATASRTRKKRTSKSTAVRRKERKVDEARHKLIEAEKELAVEELPKLVHPAMKKRGADSHVPSRIKRKHPS